jgi:5-methyltetrahydropteroyltriglutamate--homocysteine methyltransferase
MKAFAAGQINEQGLGKLFDSALEDTIRNLEATGSPVISDGEQTKPSFITYPIHGLEGLVPDGVVIPFADGHSRQLPKITRAPFRYETYADASVCKARKLTSGLPLRPKRQHSHHQCTQRDPS